jgi:hypothetical protein
MKYKILFIMGSVMIMIGLVLTTAFYVEKSMYKDFVKKGYILDSETISNQASTKYYFNAGAKYKTKYPEKIIFNDVNGNKVVTDNTGIIHYLDGSISVLKKSVIMNLDEADSKLLKYYNVFGGSTLENRNNSYYINNMNKKIVFNNFILKVSSSKYLIVSSNMKLKIDDEAEKEINQYLELNFIDGGIVKLENQEVSYQTIASDSYISFGNGLKIDLEDKNIYKGTERKLSLGQLVIDSDDNIQIVPSKETASDNDNNGNKNNNSGTNNGSNTNNNNTDPIVTNIPNFTISQMEITSNKFEATIDKQDNDALLTGSLTVKIIDNATGKTVYSKEDSSGVYSFAVGLENLNPDSSYTLIVNGTYIKDNVTYNRDFISKTFRTEMIGIDFIKNYFTKSSMSFLVKAESYSKIKSAELLLYSSSGDLLKTVEISGAQTKVANGVEVLFNDLTANTSYTVKMNNFLYDGAIISNAFEISKSFKTLRNKPTFGTPTFIIDKKNSMFTLKVNNVKDIDNGIENYKYEIYDARTLDDPSVGPVSIIEKSKWTSVDVSVDDVTIFRGVPYTYKLVAEFNDNEKVLEYTSSNSEVIMLDGVRFPSIRFETENITFERIKGNIIIEDSDSTITPNTNMIITYTDSVGNSNSFSTIESSFIPFDASGLRANETYTISLYASVNLQDGNETIDNCYIGSAIVKTATTKNLLASFNVNTSDIRTPFSINTQLKAEEGVDNLLEAQTLTGIVFNLYAGQNTSGTLIKSIKKVDLNSSPYISTLKDSLYDNAFNITPEFFGLANDDMQEEYYTIQILGAYDYTNYKNNIPVVNSTISRKTNGFIPGLPSDINNAIEVNTIRNRDAGDRYRSDLNADTIVGFRIKAGFDNAKQYAKYLKYYIYDADTNQQLPIGATTVDVDQSGTINYVNMYLGDGTLYSTQDTEFVRGHNYYFTYKAYLDLDFDGNVDIEYPYVEEGQPSVTLRSLTTAAPKQKAEFKLYPSTSTSNSMTLKYNLKDVDNSLIDNKLNVSINGSVKSNILISKSIDNNFSTTTLTNLTSGNLGINVNQALIKKAENIISRNLIYQYFDGIYSMPTLEFQTLLESNRIIITIKNYELYQASINRIAALKVTFTPTDNSDPITKDYLMLDSDNVVINLTDISSLIHKDLVISVKAYYDTGKTGFETGGTYYALQNTSNYGSSYLHLNSQLNFSDDYIANGSLFTNTFTPTSLNLSNLTYNRNKSISLSCDETGIVYNYENILLKELNLINLNGDGTQNIKFDVIVPGVSLVTNNNLDITSTLRSAVANVDLYGNNASIIEDDKLYIELYETDQSGNTSNFIREIEKTITSNPNVVTIDNLNPSSYYFIRIFANIYDGNNYVRSQLYDVDFERTDKNYNFATLSKVGITNVNAIYLPTSYSEKDISVTYNLGQIVGYNKIKYELYKVTYDINNNPIYELVNLNIADDLVFNNNMSKNIDIDPGSIVEFNQDYMLKIIPIANVTINGEQQELILSDNIEYQFHLDRLNPPFVGIVGTTTDNYGLQFKISISDIDKIIVDGVYTIKIVDEEMNDVTPEEYKNVNQSINNLNNTITLSNLTPGGKYTIVVTTYNDYQNSGVGTKTTTQYYKYVLDSNAVDIGDVYTAMNSNTRSKVDITFYNSYNLTDITSIRYSIYNLSGYAQDNSISFVPTQVGSGSEAYYYITLPEILPSEGIYYIEIQFLKDNQVIRSTSLQHNYKL